MALIVTSGFEAAVRSKLGVRDVELPDTEINQRLVLALAEAAIVKRVPDYTTITDDVDKIRLEAAVIAYICFILCPSMARRVNIEVTAIDVKWKKDKVNWDSLAQGFRAESEQLLAEISSVPTAGADSVLLGIVKGPSAIANAGGGTTG